MNENATSKQVNDMFDETHDEFFENHTDANQNDFFNYLRNLENERIKPLSERLSNLAHGSGLVKGGAEGDRKLTAEEMEENLKEDQNVSFAKKRPENKETKKLKEQLKKENDAKIEHENKYADETNFFNNIPNETKNEKLFRSHVDKYVENKKNIEAITAFRKAWIDEKVQANKDKIKKDNPLFEKYTDGRIYNPLLKEVS
jgi:hypothetical protein